MANCSSPNNSNGLPTPDPCDDTIVRNALYGGIIPDAVWHMIILVNGPILLCLAVFGMVSNSLIIVVIFRTGFKETINISLLCLAISDLFTMTLHIAAVLFTHPNRGDVGIPVVIMDAGFDIQSNLGECFKRTSNFITTYVAFERCLCIVMPLKVKTIITRCRTIFIMVTIYITSISFIMPTFFTFYIAPVFYPSLNQSVLQYLWYDDWYIEYNTNYIFSYIASSGSYVLIIISTTILIRSLRRKQDWRKSAVYKPSEDGKEPSVEIKDRNVIAMVTFISCMSIVAWAPQWLISVGSVANEDFDTFSRYHNLYMTVAVFTEYLVCLNASMNAIVYYKMSSRFRAIFKSMVRFRK